MGDLGGVRGFGGGGRGGDATGGGLSFAAGSGGSSEVSKAFQDGGSKLSKAFGIEGGLDKSQADQFASMLQDIQSKNAGKNGFDDDANTLSKQDVMALLKDQSNAPNKAGESPQAGQPPAQNSGEQAQGKDKLKDYNGDGEINKLDAILAELAKKANMEPEEFAQKVDAMGNKDGKVDIKEMLAAAKQGEGSEGDQTGRGGQPDMRQQFLSGGMQDINFSMDSSPMDSMAA
jgi:hypothetical protein